MSESARVGVAAKNGWICDMKVEMVRYREWDYRKPGVPLCSRGSQMSGTRMASSVQLLTWIGLEWLKEMTIEERVEFLMQSAQSHDRQLGEITDKLRDLTEKVAKLTIKVDVLGGMMGQLTAAMTTLAQTVTNHERRIAGLEGV